MGSTLTGAGTALTAGITAPLVGAAGASLLFFTGFEASMNKVQAMGDITGDSLGRLKAQALDLGAKTEFSAKQAADGMGEFASAGFTVDQIYAAMPGTMSLAAAGAMDVGTAAGISKDILGQFGLEAGTAGHLADVLAQAGADASGTLTDMANSLKYVGPQAKALGMSIEETTGTLVALDQAGIRGEQAGTSLRGVLASIVAPSKEASKELTSLGLAIADGNGKMLPFSSIMEQFKTKLPTSDVERANAVFKIFGRESGTAAQILIEKGGPALDSFTDKLINSEGAAKRQAETLSQGLGGALERMKGSVETAGIALGEKLAPTIISLAGFVEDAANKVGGFIDWFVKLPEPVQLGVIAVVAFGAALGPLLIAVGSVASGIGSIATVLPIMGGALSGASALVGVSTLALAGYTAGIGLAVLAIGTVIVKYNQWKDAQADAEKAADQSAVALIRLERHLRDQGAAVDDLKSQYNRGQMSQLDYQRGLQSMAIEIGKTKKATGDHSKTLTDAEKSQKAITAAIVKATKATADATKETKSSEAAVKPLKYQNDLLDETVKQLTTDYNKHVAALVTAKLKLAELGDSVATMIQPSDDLNASVQKMSGNLDNLSKAVVPSFVTVLQGMKTESLSLDSAFKTLGVTSSTEYNKVADEAKKAYDAVKGSGIATPTEQNNAMLAMLKAQRAAMVANGEQIPKDMQIMIAKMDAAVVDPSTGMPQITQKFGDFSKEVSTIMTNLAQDIGKSLWDGDTSWSEKGKAALKSIGAAATSLFVDPFTTAIGELLSGAIADLLGGKGFGGILDRVHELGKTIGSVFGAGAGAADTVMTGPMQIPGGPGGVPGVPSGGGGVAAGGGLGGIMGLTNMITGVGTMLSSIFGNFQNAQQEKTLNAIEGSTRYAMKYLGDHGGSSIRELSHMTSDHTKWALDWLSGIQYRMDASLEPLPGKLTDIANKLQFAQIRFDEIATNTYWSLRKLDDWHYDIKAIPDIVTVLGQMRDSQRPSVTINVAAPAGSNPKSFADAIARELALQGV
jgi:TP901 family phage tail tape measure protein